MSRGARIEERFGPVTESVIALRLSPEALGVLAVMLFRSGGKGVCVFGTRQITRTLKCARNKAARILRELQRRGCITRKRTSRYQWTTWLHVGPGSIPKPGRKTSHGRIGTDAATRLGNGAEGLDQTPRLTDGIEQVQDEKTRARATARRMGMSEDRIAALVP